MDQLSLLLVLDNGAACAARTQLALRLARDWNCHLVGLAPTGLPEAAESSAAAPPAEGPTMASHLHAAAERARQRFIDQCREAGIQSCSSLVDAADKVSSVVCHAHSSDLVLLTQARTEHSAGHDLVEQVVLHSARPTLVVPHTGRFEHVGQRVLVAWDDTREATRALTDALPLLRRSSRVEVVSWRETESVDDTLLRARLDAMYRWLQSHAVAAHVYLESPHGQLADAMCLRAAQIGADLIVMGAYGHARWVQRMLGGTTRAMLAAMTIPVLMSH